MLSRSEFTVGACHTTEISANATLLFPLMFPALIWLQAIPSKPNDNGSPSPAPTLPQPGRPPSRKMCFHSSLSELIGTSPSDPQSSEHSPLPRPAFSVPYTPVPAYRDSPTHLNHHLTSTITIPRHSLTVHLLRRCQTPLQSRVRRRRKRNSQLYRGSLEKSLGICAGSL